MAKGIIYVMSTVVDGLVKIGKTTDFESRMSILESNGYRNVTGLKRRFAIEVDSYDEKEALLDDIFGKSRVGNTELFSLDINIVIQLLSSFEGKQIYPMVENKIEVFENATEAVQSGMIPNGTYYLTSKIKSINKTVNAILEVIDGKLLLKKNSDIAVINGAAVNEQPAWIKIRNTLPIRDEKLLEDIEVNSFSTAACFVTGHNQNGWVIWKNASGQPIDIYRKNGIDD